VQWNISLRLVRQADILSAFFSLPNEVQLRWAHRLESLCSLAILARLCLHRFRNPNPSAEGAWDWRRTGF